MKIYRTRIAGDILKKVDHRGELGQFILIGSAAPPDTKEITHSETVWIGWRSLCAAAVERWRLRCPYRRQEALILFGGKINEYT